MKRSLRPDSCCSVDVVNGARGFSVNGSDSVLVTAKATSRRRSASPAAARASSSTTSATRVAAIGAGRGVEVATLGDALAVELDERRTERSGSSASEAALEVAPLPGAEAHAGPLALDDHAHRNALHAPGRRGLAAAEHAPQHRRRLPADEAVELAAAFLRLDELHVELAGVLDRFADRVRRDLVEHHPLHGHVRLEHLEHVPADRLALAILVGREDELVGALERLLQLGDDLLLVGVHHVAGVEVVVGVDAGEAAVGLLLVVRDLVLVRGRSRM